MAKLYIIIICLLMVCRGEIGASTAQEHSYLQVDTVIFADGQRLGRPFTPYTVGAIRIVRALTVDTIEVDTTGLSSRINTRQLLTDTSSYDATKAFVNTGLGLKQPFTDTSTYDATRSYVLNDFITLTNKRITPRVITRASATSLTPTSDSADVVLQVNTGSAGTLTINSPTGTPTDGQRLELVIKCTNQQTLSFNSVYVGSNTGALPTMSTGSSKTDRLYFEWFATASKWQLINYKLGYQ